MRCLSSHGRFKMQVARLIALFIADNFILGFLNSPCKAVCVRLKALSGVISFHSVDNYCSVLSAKGKLMMNYELMALFD